MNKGPSMEWLLNKFKCRKPHADEPCCRHICKPNRFEPHASFGDLNDVSIGDAIQWIDQIIDDIGVCSNHITKDREAWTRVAMMAMVGDKMNEIRKEGGKPALHAFIDSLPE